MITAFQRKSRARVNNKDRLKDIMNDLYTKHFDFEPSKNDLQQQ